MTSSALFERERGSVFIEFLISFVPLFLLFLGTTQLCLIHAAQLVVQHAAVQAARVAVVTLDDDPCFYGGAPRGVLSQRGSKPRSQAAERGLAVLGLGAETGKAPSAQGATGGARLGRIRSAAYLPLSVIAPMPSQLLTMLPWASDTLPSLASDRSVAGALGNHPSLRIASGYAAYNRLASAITFPHAPAGAELRDLSQHAVAKDEPLTVRVTYLFSCDVPVVRELICQSFLAVTGWEHAERRIESLRAASSMQSARAQGAALLSELSSSPDTARQLARELGHAEWKSLVPTLASPGNKYVVLRAEATLPNQGAPYLYPSELGQVDCEGMPKAGDAS